MSLALTHPGNGDSVPGWLADSSLVTKVMFHPLKWGQRAVLNLRVVITP